MLEYLVKSWSASFHLLQFNWEAKQFVPAAWDTTQTKARQVQALQDSLQNLTPDPNQNAKVAHPRIKCI